MDETSTTETNETVTIFLTTTMSAQEWELTIPTHVPVQALIARFVREPELGIRVQDDVGNPIPYRLMWEEGERYLRETETLNSAGIEEGHTLRLTHEARAG